MKEVKIGLVVSVLVVIGFFVWKWSSYDDITQRDVAAKVEHVEKADVNSTKTTSSSKDKEREPDFEKEFWSLIQKGSQEKMAYDNLIKKYSDIGFKNEIKLFYDAHLSRSDEFKKFNDIRVIDLKRVKSLEELKELIEAEK
jgi:hypothetical protein